MTFWARVRGKILEKWIVRHYNDGLLLLYITGFPNGQSFPGYYCIIKKGTQFNYMNIKALYDPLNEKTYHNMKITKLRDILDCSSLRDAEIKKKLAKYFAKRLLTL